MPPHDLEPLEQPTPLICQQKVLAKAAASYKGGLADLPDPRLREQPPWE